jgi:hypothetical protein
MNFILLFYHNYVFKKKYLFYLFIFILFFLFEILRINVPVYTLHIFYLFSLYIYILNIYLLYNSNFKFTSSIFPFLIKYILRISLIIALISLITKPYISAGWVWPINIALQEIVLVSFFYSELIFFGQKKSMTNYLIFILLLIFRDSGKATLVSLLILPFFKYFYIDKNRINKIYVYFKYIWMSHIIIIIISIIFISIILSLQKTSIIRYILLKRFIYIQEAINFLTNGFNFILGSGFGPDNYFLSATKLTMKNAPQLLPLTIIVFGGIILYFFYLSTTLIFFNSFNKETKYDFYIKSYLVSLLIIMTFHEYFVNPLVYFSIGIVLVSYKTNLLNNEI